MKEASMIEADPYGSAAGVLSKLESASMLNDGDVDVINNLVSRGNRFLSKCFIYTDVCCISEDGVRSLQESPGVFNTLFTSL